MNKKEIVLVISTAVIANFISGLILLYIEKKYFDEIPVKSGDLL